LNLAELDLKEDYRSDRDNLIDDFYIPCLAKATLYRRAVGFFSSSSMAIAAKGLTALIRSGGKMQLITSPKLSSEDTHAIAMGLQQREEIIARAIARELDREFENIVGDRLACLAWLLARDILEIKLAITKAVNGYGIYHEKLGIFTDRNNDSVAFTGSANESSSGLIANFECIDVFCSWSSAVRSRVLRKVQNFDRLWNNRTDNVEVIEFPEAARRSLLRMTPDRPPTEERYEVTFNQFSVSEARDNYNLKSSKKQNTWRHQSEAIEIFLDHCHGVLEMATGTGKTRTALTILQKLVELNAIDSVIITTIGTDLLDQWTKQLYPIATRLNPRFRVLQHYEQHHQREEYSLDPDCSILVISRNALRYVLRCLDRQTRSRLLIIHDEVHGLGSPANIENLDGLSVDIAYRLGLSATPEREYDREGTDFIEQNVGSVIYRFSLEDAIKRGILCEFDYHGIEYEISEEDRQRIRGVYVQKQSRKKEGNPMSNEEFWTALARVYKTSKAKLPYFEAFLDEYPEVLNRAIVFVEDRQYGEEVLDLIHHHRHDFHTYYADDDRQKLIDFAEGKINCLITCHRISQGIDIQSLRSVILLSSARAKLETIQRMGRCLRKDPANPDKRAIVVDFIRTQEEDKEELNSDQERKQWLEDLSKINR
jgi:superfamily II DNA or RNA helicase